MRSSWRELISRCNASASAGMLRDDLRFSVADSIDDEDVALDEEEEEEEEEDAFIGDEAFVGDEALTAGMGLRLPEDRRDILVRAEAVFSRSCFRDLLLFRDSDMDDSLALGKSVECGGERCGGEWRW
jgi:hypothetical protein